jgi:voltage-gated sodium channel
MRQYIKKLVENRLFEIFIFLIIILNTIVLGLLVSDKFSSRAIQIFEIISKICISIYIIEAVLEIYAWRLLYFKNGWNVFDFIIVIILLFPNVGIFSGIRSLRILNVFRSFATFRLISKFKQFRKIINAMILSLPGIGWTVVLMILMYYIFSIIGIHIFKDEFPESFGSLSISFVTLFSLTTMEGWQDTVYPIVEYIPIAWFYFIIFFIIASYILLNLIFGIIVDNISVVSSEEDNSSINFEIENELKQLIKKTSDIDNKLNMLLKDKNISEK